MMLKEDQELISKLRSKYKDRGANDTQSVQPDRGLTGSQGADSITHAHLCHVCQGSGTQTEVYEYRRLESCCSHCQGEGVMVSGSKSSQQQARSCSNSTSCAAGSEPSTTAAAVGEAKYRRQTERQLGVLEQKIAALTQERESLQASLAAPSSDVQQHKLQENLIQQVQLHVDRLEVVRSAKRAMLEHQSNGSSVGQIAPATGP